MLEKNLDGNRRTGMCHPWEIIANQAKNMSQLAFKIYVEKKNS